MAEANTEPKHPPQKPILVQTKLTSAFFHPAASRTSPYFARPTTSHSNPTTTAAAAAIAAISDDAVDTAAGGLPKPTSPHDAPSPPPNKINLFPERRAPLRRGAPPPPLPSTRTSTLLSLIATETKLLLPSLLSSAPHAPPTGHLFHPDDNLPRLCPSTCPHLPTTKIEVVNADTIDTALSLTSFPSSSSTSPSPSPLPSSPPPPPILILNMANAQHGGGGWLKGALAQEESLCYRTSLSFTLKRRFYPLREKAAIYSPSVLVFRESIAAGHDLLDLSHPHDLPVLSVVSVAAVRDPAVEGGQGEFGRYRHGATRALMKEKMRVVLRVAALRGHRVLVLGALGCGAFGNPRGEVVACWGEVLAEEEFRGGWWEKVVFAVMEEGGEREGEGNFGVFWRGLHGVEV